MDKNIVITGASKGIGKALALIFAQNSCHVVICARGKETLQETLEEVKLAFPKGNHEGFSVDMGDKNQVLSFAKEVKKHFNHVDILVNNAGIFIPNKLIEEEISALESMIQVNLMGSYYLTKSLLPKMMERQQGQIVNIGSIAGLQAYPSGGSYSITKFALNGFSKALREELKSYGIKVSVVHPGATYTASWDGVDLPKSRFIDAKDIAQQIWTMTQLSENTVVEEMVIRPQLGDI